MNRLDPIARFWNRVTAPTEPGGCMPWIPDTGPDGYANLYWAGLSRGAHVVSYTLAYGPVPKGLTVDHLCHNRDLQCPGGKRCPHRRCVRPDHLEAVTIRINTLRSTRTITRINMDKTSCAAGHPYDTANTYIRPTADGYLWRDCRACRSQAVQRYRSRKKTTPGELECVSVERSAEPLLVVPVAA